MLHSNRFCYLLTDLLSHRVHFSVGAHQKICMKIEPHC